MPGNDTGISPGEGEITEGSGVRGRTEESVGLQLGTEAERGLYWILAVGLGIVSNARFAFKRGAHTFMESQILLLKFP